MLTPMAWLWKNKQKDKAAVPFGGYINPNRCCCGESILSSESLQQSKQRWFNEAALRQDFTGENSPLHLLCSTPFWHSAPSHRSCSSKLSSLCPSHSWQQPKHSPAPFSTAQKAVRRLWGLATSPWARGRGGTASDPEALCASWSPCFWKRDHCLNCLQKHNLFSSTSWTQPRMFCFLPCGLARLCFGDEKLWACTAPTSLCIPGLLAFLKITVGVCCRAELPACPARGLWLCQTACCGSVWAVL